MSTRSTIAIETKNGAVQQVYCHYDGYPSYVGRILLENYSTPEKLQSLIEQGSISSLDKSIGTKHSFDDRPEGETTFYARDRGEELDLDEYWNFEVYRCSAYMEEYNYIMRNDGIWYFSKGSGKFTRLTETRTKELF